MATDLAKKLQDAGVAPLDVETILNQHDSTEVLSREVLRKEALLGWWYSSAIPQRYKRLLSATITPADEPITHHSSVEYALDTMEKAGTLLDPVALTLFSRIYKMPVTLQTLLNNETTDPVKSYYIEKLSRLLGVTHDA